VIVKRGIKSYSVHEVNIMNQNILILTDDELDHLYQHLKWQVVGETEKKFPDHFKNGCPICTSIIGKIKELGSD
jgi:hypothetical protein